jgi:hypothetical protein
LSELTPQRQLSVFLAKFDTAVAAAARTALKQLRLRLAGATEIVYDNYNALAIGFGPSDKASEAIVSIAVYPRWVSLFFLQNGVQLKDPNKLLKGTGSKVRHIVLTSPGILASPDIERLMVQALASAKTRLLPQAKRRIVIKSIAAKQRPRRPGGVTKGNH